jgi:hypothetical protein
MPYAVQMIVVIRADGADPLGQPGAMTAAVLRRWRHGGGLLELPNWRRGTSLASLSFRPC